METNELLRVGNWVINNGRERQLDEWSISGFDFVNFQPIPLTKEWLIRLGFCEHSHAFKGDVKLSFVNADRRKPLILMYCNMFLPDYINSVHRLQNLYFTMTGNELTVKDETVLDRLKESSKLRYTKGYHICQIIQDIENGVITKLK